jgi:hypothetical protein
MDVTEAEGTRGSILNLGAITFAMYKEGQLRSQRFDLIKQRIVMRKLITALAAMPAHLALLFAPADFVLVVSVAVTATLASTAAEIMKTNLTPLPQSASEWVWNGVHLAS